MGKILITQYEIKKLKDNERAQFFAVYTPDPDAQEKLGIADAIRGEAPPFAEAKKRIVDAFERDYLAGQLDRADSNLSKAARNSGVDRSYFKRLLKRHDLLPKREE